MDATKNLPQDLQDKLEHALGSGLSESRKALRVLLDCANTDLKGQAASVLTPSGDDGLQFFESTDDKFTVSDFPTIPLGSSITGFVFLSGQSMALDDAQQSTHFYAEIDERSGFTTKEYLATPIVLGNNVLGVLTVANRSEQLENSMFSRDELILADKYSRLCALVLDHDNRVRRRTAATSDALRRIFSAEGGAAASGLAATPDGDAWAVELREQVQDALDAVSERDLELVRDLAERLAELASRDPS